jgi:subtilisin family serine protease
MRKFAFLLMTMALLAGNLAYGRQVKSQPAWRQKVDDWVWQTAGADEEAEFLVFLAQQADVSGAAALPGKEAKGAYVYEQLTAVAQRTQPAVVAALQQMGVSYRPYWIANMIWVRGNAGSITALAQRADVAHLYANPAVTLDEPITIRADDLTATDQAVEWNIDLVHAPEVWATGHTGQGVVIGGQDTGYEWDHPGLVHQYRGWDGNTADHNYNWHDAIHSGGGSCGANTEEPCDDYGHGSHTMGTMVGNDLAPADIKWPAGASNAVGMAPGARWIGCRNMNVGVGTPATYSECYQWFLAPTDLNGQQPDPAKAPHVISNSWGCPPSEGCTDANVLLTVVENVRAAGILTVHSAGNSGPSCHTVNTPASIYDASFTVGATAADDAIASFSSRGSVSVDGSNRLKPDISAPGVSIRSTTRNDSYGFSSGTSMAAPHVAGLVALLISAQPALAGQVDILETIIQASAVPLTSSENCGGLPGSAAPNNTFGYGRIDALSALQAITSYTFYFPVFSRE